MIAFAIPFPFIYSSIAIILCTAVWLFQVRFRDLAKNLVSGKILWIWILFFLLHVVSYTYSIDKNESTFDIQRKLSFFLLPIVIGAGMTIDQKTIERILVSFVVGVTVVGIFCMARALIIYNHTGETRQFFYHPLIKGFNANAVYQSLYALFSITILLFFNWSIKMMRYLRFLLGIILIVFFILLSSRTLIIIFFILILPLYIKTSFANTERSSLYALIFLMFYLTLALVIFSTDNPIKQRYTEIISNNEKINWNNLKNSKNDYNNLSLRLFLWKVGYDNIREHNYWLYGAGNGSIYTLQNKKMAEYGVTDIYNEKNRSPLYNVNLHNMYLQVLMMLGIIGLIVFSTMLVSPLFYIKYFKYKNILFIFNIVILVLMMQESSLQTQAGIVYYSFFSMVFYSNNRYSRQSKYDQA